MSSFAYMHAKNGTTYVYQSTAYWDKEKKAPRNRMKCVGKLDPKTGKVIYNREYASRDAQAAAASGAAVSETVSVGAGLLLGKVTEDLGFERLLVSSIGKGKTEMVISLAWYLCCRGDALYLAPGWMESHACPCHGAPPDNQAVTEFLRSFGRDDILKFLKAWLKGSKDDGYLCYDITSVSSYSGRNGYVEWGHNRDGERMEQVNLALLSGQDSDIPFYYKLLPGSLHDSRTLKEMLSELSALKAGKVRLMMDKGFYSKANITAMQGMGCKFVIPIPSTLRIRDELVDEVRDGLQMPDNIVQETDGFVYGVTVRRPFCGKRTYYHVYLDTSAQQESANAFVAHIRELRGELERNEPDGAHEDEYKRFFTVSDTPKRGRVVRLIGQNVMDYRDRYAGYWILMTNCEKDAGKALAQYRRRDMIEKNFDDMKNELDMKRLRIQGTEAMESRTFIQFIALALKQRILKMAKESVLESSPTSKNLHSKYTVREIFSRLESYQEISFTGKYKTVRPSLTKAQAEIFSTFGIDPLASL